MRIDFLLASAGSSPRDRPLPVGALTPVRWLWPLAVSLPPVARQHLGGFHCSQHTPVLEGASLFPVNSDCIIFYITCFVRLVYNYYSRPITQSTPLREALDTTFIFAPLTKVY